MAIKLEVAKPTAKKYSEEDLRPHETVAGIFMRGTGDAAKYLTQDHVKHNMLCPPIGKVKPDQTITEALIAEIKEETNLKVTQYSEIFSFKLVYKFGDDKVPITTHVFKIIAYTGVLKNAEPKKHRWIKWMTRKEIEKSGRKIADAYLNYFKWLDEISTPSMTRPNVTVGMSRA